MNESNNHTQNLTYDDLVGKLHGNCWDGFLRTHDTKRLCFIVSKTSLDEISLGLQGMYETGKFMYVGSITKENLLCILANPDVTYASVLTRS